MKNMFFEFSSTKLPKRSGTCVWRVRGHWNLFSFVSWHLWLWETPLEPRKRLPGTLFLKTRFCERGTKMVLVMNCPWLAQSESLSLTTKEKETLSKGVLILRWHCDSQHESKGYSRIERKRSNCRTETVKNVCLEDPRPPELVSVRFVTLMTRILNRKHQFRTKYVFHYFECYCINFT